MKQIYYCNNKKCSVMFQVEILVTNVEDIDRKIENVCCVFCGKNDLSEITEEEYEAYITPE